MMFYTSLILLSLCILFLYFTASAGVKFYETRLQRDDVKNIKRAIHTCFAAIVLIIGFMFYKGYINDEVSQPVLDTKKIEAVETEKRSK